MKNYICLYNRVIWSLLFIFSVTLSYSQQNNSDSLLIPSDHQGIFIEKNSFNKGYIVNPIQLIQGKIAGLSISKAGGDPNNGFEIHLRGLSSISGKNVPIFVIDGVPVTTLDNLEPDNIESISVLKNGSVLYPEAGTSGVILISTKRRTKNTTIEYNVYTSAEQVARNLTSLSAEEWRKLSKEMSRGNDLGENTNWNKEIEQTALSQVHSISISGGSDKTDYRASFNYRSAQGVLRTTGFSQFNGRISLSQKALKDKLTLDMNVAASERESQIGFAEAFKYAAISNPTSPVRSTDAAFEKYDGYFQQVLFDYYNPVSIIELNKNESKRRILNFSVKANYDITKRLSINALYASQNINFLDGKYFDMNDYFGGMSRNGLASRTENTYSDNLFQSSIIYNGKFINAIGGYYLQEFTDDGFYAQGGNFLTDYFTFNNLSASLDFKNGKGSVSSYKHERKQSAFFGLLTFNINDKISITTGTRYEGTSIFATAQKWTFLPSAGITVRMAEFLSTDLFNILNLRAGYTVSGNHPDHRSENNSSLDWEKKNEINAGIDYSLSKSRFSGSLDFYSGITSDLILSVMVPVPPNIYGQTLMNFGKLKSSGLEFSFNYKAVDKNDFSYVISLNTSYNLKNEFGNLEATSNGTTLRYGTQELGEMGAPGQLQVPLARIQESSPVGQLIALVYKDIDANGYIQYVDQNHDGFINQADRTVVGNGIPKMLLGFGNILSYKGWDLNIFFRGVFGHDLVNSYRALYEVPNMISTYNLPESATEMRNASGKLLNSTSGMLSDKAIENASFISLDNISLGYNFHFSENSPVKKIRLYVAGNNLAYFTGYKGTDPNPRYSDQNNLLLPGIDRVSSWPRTRSFTFGALVLM